MSYMYGKRGTCKETALTAAIRGELYSQDYSSIDWNAARNQCAKEDLYYPHPKVMATNYQSFSLFQPVLWHIHSVLCCNSGQNAARCGKADLH